MDFWMTKTFDSPVYTSVSESALSYRFAYPFISKASVLDFGTLTQFCWFCILIAKSLDL